MMKSIRRSIKGEKAPDFSSSYGTGNSTQRHTHMSITPKSALTITPPKKVIRALEAYEPQSDQELGFEKGDFFHVISHENHQDWYEACNPATGARGFVPVPYFQVLGKNERDSQDSVTDKDSGYSVMPPPDRMSTSTHRVASPPASVKSGGAGAPPGSKSGGPLYGVVIYDFSAERPDELDAKAGEPIIVIAQSNSEWFVAKPIGRLGGPGLIPVDFIELRDMATNEPIADAKAAIARAGVPKVEEWKKMAAEYKNSSIALGKFDDGSAAPSQQMENMSLNDNRNTMKSYNGSRNSRASGSAILLAPTSASVVDYSYENQRYWYIMDCTMEDGRSWSLCRYYEDFYDFQIALLDEFKEEAGHTGRPRILPYMPGPVTYVTDTISACRRQSLDDYIKKLLELPPYISQGRLVKMLFAPRPSDIETTQYNQSIDSNGHPTAAGNNGIRASAGSHQSSDSSREPSRQSSAHIHNGSSNGNGYPGLSAPPPRTSAQQHARHPTNGSNHLRTNSDLHTSQSIHQPPRMQRNDTSYSTASGASGLSADRTVKVKIEYGDDMIAVLLPRDIGWNPLVDKVQERLGVQEVRSVEYKDENTGEMVEIRDEGGLRAAMGMGKVRLVVN